eukprot:691297-Pyramimonas_sp.AAC.1
MLPPLIRLVQAVSLCSLPSSDWSKLRVYAPSRPPIGPSCEYMLPRIAPVAQRVSGVLSAPLPLLAQENP